MCRLRTASAYDLVVVGSNSEGISMAEADSSVLPNDHTLRIAVSYEFSESVSSFTSSLLLSGRLDVIFGAGKESDSLALASSRFCSRNVICQMSFS